MNKSDSEGNKFGGLFNILLEGLFSVFGGEWVWVQREKISVMSNRRRGGQEEHPP